MKTFRLIKEEKANAVLENVLIMPLILFVIFFMIIASFVIHDRATLDAAVSRGAVYATKCIADPFYAEVLSGANTSPGSLDATISSTTDLVFSTKKKINGAANNGINPYRYITSSFKSNIESLVKTEVKHIVDATRIPWREIPADNIKCDVTNYVVYQKVVVSAKVEYHLPAFFDNLGLPDKLEYSAVSVATVTDPDELIRNADFVTDLLGQILKATGADTKVEQLTAKIKGFGDKIKNSPITKFFKVN